MATAVLFEKKELRLKLKDLGLSDNQLEEMSSLFDQKSKHVDIITFVTTVERFGIARGGIYAFLKGAGIDDPTLITVFSRADLKKAGLDEDKVQEVVFSD